MGSIFNRNYELFLFSLLWKQDKVLRPYTQEIMSREFSGKLEKWGTLGSLCPPCYMQNAAWVFSHLFIFIIFIKRIIFLFLNYNVNIDCNCIVSGQWTDLTGRWAWTNYSVQFHHLTEGEQSALTLIAWQKEKHIPRNFEQNMKNELKTRKFFNYDYITSENNPKRGYLLWKTPKYRMEANVKVNFMRKVK